MRKKPCPFCGRMCHPKGLYAHKRSCNKNNPQQQQVETKSILTPRGELIYAANKFWENLCDHEKVAALALLMEKI